MDNVYRFPASAKIKYESVVIPEEHIVLEPQTIMRDGDLVYIPRTHSFRPPHGCFLRAGSYLCVIRKALKYSERVQGLVKVAIR